MENNDMNEMEEMKISKLALKTSIPMIISMISIAVYGIVDTIFVSGISEKALTAISLAYPIQNIITSIGLGTGIGINALLAKTLGEKNENKVQKIILNGLLVTFIIWILIGIIFSVFSNVTLSFFTTDAILVSMGASYLIILSAFSVGTLFQITIEKTLEAYGKTKESMIVQVVGSIINLILDPILIYGLLGCPKLGIIGAAIATVIGQIIGMLIGIIYMKKYKLLKIKISKENLKLDTDIVKEIYIVGVPTIVLEIVSSVIMLWVNKLLITFSDSAVSAWGVYGKIDKLVLITIYGLNYGMIPIVAYNLGAKRRDRVKEAILYFTKLSAIITLIGTAIVMAFPKEILNIFEVSKSTLEIGIPAFKILAMGFVFGGLNLVLGAIFQAFRNANYSLIIKLLRKLIIIVPLIYLFKDKYGINAVWWSFTFSEFITSIVAVMLLKKEFDKLERE